MSEPLQTSVIQVTDDNILSRNRIFEVHSLTKCLYVFVVAFSFLFFLIYVWICDIANSKEIFEYSTKIDCFVQCIPKTFSVKIDFAQVYYFRSCSSACFVNNLNTIAFSLLFLIFQLSTSMDHHNIYIRLEMSSQLFCYLSFQ